MIRLIIAPQKSMATGLFLVSLCFVALLLPLLPTQAQRPAAQPVEAKREDSERRSLTDAIEEVEKLKEEIQRLKTALEEQRRHMEEIKNHLILAPEVDAQPEDYAQARSRFKTKLLRKGPSPQPWPMVKSPAGVTEIEYLSGELRLKAWMNRPADESRKHPAVLYLHGGFYFASGAWDQARLYRDAGFVVLTPILRAENGQPGAWSYFYDEVDDVLAAADYLSKQPYVDASRLFVAGHSTGGTLTLLAALASPRFRAAASFDGAPYRPDFVNHAKNVPFDNSDPHETRLRSPIAYAGSFKCPVRMYHAKESQGAGLMSLRTAALAKLRGLDVEAVEMEGNHATHVPQAMKQSIEFFQKVSAQ
jgi:dienelactone hydrolase